MRKSTCFILFLLIGTLQVVQAQTETTDTAAAAAPRRTRVNPTPSVKAWTKTNVDVNIDNDNDNTQYTEKTITRELEISKGGDILIENSNKNVEIKVWDQPKVKLVAVAYIKSSRDDYSEDDLLDRMGISFKSFGGGVQVLSKGSSAYSYSGNYVKGQGSISVSGAPAAKATAAKRNTLTIYVPASAKLEVDNRYSQVSITGKLESLKLVAQNSPVEIEDVTNLSLRSKYGNTVIKSCKEAEVEHENGRFSLKTVGKIEIDSKYGSVELGTVGEAVIHSSSDDYDIENIATLRGRKNYGDLRIGTLTKSLEIDGSNADIRVRNTASSVDVFKVNNKYADLRLPVKELQNYSVDMQGKYNNVYASFEKVPVKETPQQAAKTDDQGSGDKSAGTPRYVFKGRNDDGDPDNPGHFTAKVGNGGPKFLINCTSCTVDFK